jgi:hypothetical protein
MAMVIKSNLVDNKSIVTFVKKSNLANRLLEDAIEILRQSEIDGRARKSSN